MDARGITKSLGGKWAGRYGLARCPVHNDRTPSLKISDDPRKDDGVDIHCFGGCRWRDVKDALVRGGLLPEFKPTSFSTSFFTTPPLPAPDRADEAERVDLALKIWGCRWTAEELTLAGAISQSVAACTSARLN